MIKELLLCGSFLIPIFFDPHPNQMLTPPVEWPTNGEMHRITWQRPSHGPEPKGYRIFAARHLENWQLLGQTYHTQLHFDFDAEALPPGLVFLIVVAFNDAGESITEHGDFAGEGWFPESLP